MFLSVRLLLFVYVYAALFVYEDACVCVCYQEIEDPETWDWVSQYRLKHNIRVKYLLLKNIKQPS